MDMSFFASSKVDHIVFEGWKVSNAAGMFGSCFAVVLIAIIFEMVKSYKVHHKAQERQPESMPLIPHPQQDHSRFEWTSHLKATLGYLFQFAVGYFLMLVAMTYNVWLFLSVVVGCGLGYFLVVPCMGYCYSRHKAPARTMLASCHKAFTASTVTLEI